MARNRIHIYNYLTALIITASWYSAAYAQEKHTEIPRLVVNITIDRFNSDCLEAFDALYTNGGFKKLLAEGCVYENAINDFYPVDIASATATISTGATPYFNGIVAQSWLDRASLRPVFCTDDKKVASTTVSGKASPRRLLTSTIGDELKIYTQGNAKVYGIAADRDAAILSVGHSADCAIWIDDNNGVWTSTDYYPQARAPWLTTFNKAYGIPTTINKQKWTPLNTSTSMANLYIGQNAQMSFNHRFAGNMRFREFKKSALVNTEITTLALQCQLSNNLGKDEITDYLAIQYYAGYFNELSPSECHLELLDTYLRLDKELKKLIETIETRIGKDKVLFVISSTGYDTVDNNDYDKYKIPTGTVYLNRTANLLNMYLGSIYGQGQYVDAIYSNQIYLNHKLLENQHISLSDILSRSSEFLHMSEGVRDVHTASSILSATNGYSLQLRHAYNPTLSGDIIVEVAPGWKIVNENTADSKVSTAPALRFPIIFYGSNLKGKMLSDVISTDRIAPTITKAIRIRAPNGCRSLPLF